MLASVSFFTGMRCPADTPADKIPDTFLMDGRILAESKRLILSKDITAQAAYSNLLQKAEEVMKAMRQVIEGEDGTAQVMKYYIKDMPLAAKTGTAQPQTVGSKRDHSWFVCIAPADDPQLVIAVMGENAGWGSVVGLRTAKDVIIAARKLGYFDRKPGLLERLFGSDTTGGGAK